MGTYVKNPIVGIYKSGHHIQEIHIHIWHKILERDLLYTLIL